MKYPKIALFLCWVLLGIGVAGASQSYKRQLEEGRKLLEAKNFSKAAKKFKVARKLAAKDVDVDADVAEILRGILESEPVSDDKFSNSVRIRYCDLRHGLDPDGGEVSEKSVQLIMGSIQSPKKIRSVDPKRTGNTQFPARFHDRQGRVALRAVIDQMGCVTRLELVDSTAYPTLNRRALDAASRWVFRPATANGKPISVHYQLMINVRPN